MDHPRLSPITGVVDTDPEVVELQDRIYREMSPARKLEIVDDLIRTNRQLLWAGLRHRHPDEPDARLERRLLGLVLGEDLATRAYGPLDAGEGDEGAPNDASGEAR